MAHDEALAERIRAVLADHQDVSEQKMFGGIAFMIGGRPGARRAAAAPSARPDCLH